MEHNLKIWPMFFKPVIDGCKKFEYRRDDRNFQIGNALILHEWDPMTEKYTGRAVRVMITYILRDCPALPGGYCIMQFGEWNYVESSMGSNP